MVEQQHMHAAMRRGRVLLVDDEHSMLVLLERLLRTEHDIVSVSSAAEAMALLVRGEHFDLLLCDVMMPGMSGLELHERLRDEHPEVAAKVVFCTAGADSPQFRAFVDESGTRFISKPFKVAQLRALVRDFVGW